jgi:hypothetical protein
MRFGGPLRHRTSLTVEKIARNHCSIRFALLLLSMVHSSSRVCSQAVDCNVRCTHHAKSGAHCRAGLRYGSTEDLPFSQLSSLFSDAGPWTTVRLDTEYYFFFFRDWRTTQGAVPNLVHTITSGDI